MDHDERRRIDEWMARLAEGERDAFDPLFSALWSIVRRFAERSLGSGADAEDAAQTALLKVFARAAEYDPERDAVTWVLGIVAFECRTIRTRARRRREDDGASATLADTPSQSASPEEAVIARDLETALALVAESLRASDAETLLLVMTEQRERTPSFRKRVERMLSRLRDAWRAKHDVD